MVPSKAVYRFEGTAKAVPMMLHLEGFVLAVLEVPVKYLHAVDKGNNMMIGRTLLEVDWFDIPDSILVVLGLLVHKILELAFVCHKLVYLVVGWSVIRLFQ